MTGMTAFNFATYTSQQKISVSELNKTSTTTLNGGTNTTTVLTSANTINYVAGRVYIVMLAWDPSGNSVPTVTITGGGNTWTALSALYPAPATTSAGTGVITQAFITTAGTTTTGTYAATFSAGITNKAMTLIQLQGATATQRNTATTSRGTTAAPNYASPSGNQYDMILTTVAQETNTANQPTSGSTSTTNGTWVAISNNFTSGGGAATNVGISYQYKLLTATGTQTNTWTMGSTNNWGSQSFAIAAA